jgi:hypothetical protein
MPNTLGASSPLDAIRIARDADVPSHLKHTLLVLASYHPNIFPSLRRLAGDMGIDKSAAARRLRLLEDEGLIRTVKGTGRTTSLRVLQLDRLRELRIDHPQVSRSHHPQVSRSDDSQVSHGRDPSTIGKPLLSRSRHPQGSSERDPKSNRKGKPYEGNSYCELADRLAAILTPHDGALDHDELRDALTSYARGPEHALQVGRRLAADLDDYLTVSSRGAAAMYRTRLRVGGGTPR